MFSGGQFVWNSLRTLTNRRAFTNINTLGHGLQKSVVRSGCCCLVEHNGGCRCFSLAVSCVIVNRIPTRKFVIFSSELTFGKCSRTSLQKATNRTERYSETEKQPERVSNSHSTKTPCCTLYVDDLETLGLMNSIVSSANE